MICELIRDKLQFVGQYIDIQFFLTIGLYSTVKSQDTFVSLTAGSYNKLLFIKRVLYNKIYSEVLTINDSPKGPFTRGQ